VNKQRSPLSQIIQNVDLDDHQRHTLIEEVVHNARTALHEANANTYAVDAAHALQGAVRGRVDEDTKRAQKNARRRYVILSFATYASLNFLPFTENVMLLRKQLKRLRQGRIKHNLCLLRPIGVWLSALHPHPLRPHLLFHCGLMKYYLSHYGMSMQVKSPIGKRNFRVSSPV
jgi:hypothetical protein